MSHTDSRSAKPDAAHADKVDARCKAGWPSACAPQPNPCLIVGARPAGTQFAEATGHNFGRHAQGD